MPSWIVTVIVLLVGGGLALKLLNSFRKSQKRLRVLRERGYYVVTDERNDLYAFLVNAQRGVVLLAGPTMTMEHALEVVCAAHLAPATVVAKCVINVGPDGVTISSLMDCIGNIARRQEATQTLLTRWAKDQKPEGYSVRLL